MAEKSRKIEGLCQLERGWVLVYQHQFGKELRMPVVQYKKYGGSPAFELLPTEQQYRRPN